MNITKLAAVAINADAAIKMLSDKHAETRGAWPAADELESDQEVDAWARALDALADLPSQNIADC